MKFLNLATNFSIISEPGKMFDFMLVKDKLVGRKLNNGLDDTDDIF